MIAPASSDLVFGDFLEHLRRQGFIIGIDHYLRLQELLNKTSDKCAPDDLKTLLCPILATNPAQQEQFYHAFEAYYELFQSASPHSKPSLLVEEAAPAIIKEPKPAAPRKWLYVLAGTLSIGLILALALFMTRNQAQREHTPEPVAQPQQEPQTDTQVIQVVPAPGKTSPSTDGGQKIDIPPSPPPPDIEPPETSAPKPNPEPTFYQRYGSAIRIGAIAAPLIFFLIYELYRFNRRKLVLHKQRGKKPPYVWPVKIERPNPRLYDSEQFYTTARRMRRRRIAEFHRLDISATIAATVESLGYPSFRYKPDSKPPEYLVLIDRASFRDHQSQLFNELAKALDQEGLFIAGYFYDGDPRICRSETGDSIHLLELQNKYSEHRLLIFGNGEKIIDPLTGKFEAWAAVLLDWKERAVLTPEASSKWGLREITLASQFIVLPATLDGLLTVVDHFEVPARTDPSLWQQDDVEAPPAEARQSEIVEALRNYLGEEAFQWLCACAVYPELQWDLTLYLGTLSCMSSELVGEETLLRLVRLPWFRAGAMPDDVRWALVRELDRDKEKAIRAAIIDLLEKNPPPKETIAEDGYRLNLAVQRWLYRRTRKMRREMLRIMRTLPRSKVLQDHTLLRFLESARHSPLDIILPRRLRKLFYRNGVPAFGLRTSIRLILTLVIASSAWFGASALVAPPGSDTSRLISEAQADKPSADSQITNTNSAAPPSQPDQLRSDRQNTDANTSATTRTNIVGSNDAQILISIPGIVSTFTLSNNVRVTGNMRNLPSQAVTLTVNGSPLTIAPSNGEFAVDVALALGVNRIRASQGNVLSNEIVLERGPYFIRITSPQSRTTTASSVRIAGEYKGVPPKVNTIIVTVNGASSTVQGNTVQGNNDNNAQTFDVVVPLALGENKIVVAIPDASDQIVITRLAPAAVIISSPPNGTVTAERLINVSGTAENTLLETITLNVNGRSSQIPVSAGKFSTSVELAPGKNLIRASAGDAVSNEVTVNFEVPQPPPDECSKINCDCRKTLRSRSAAGTWSSVFAGSFTAQPSIFSADLNALPQPKSNSQQKAPQQSAPQDNEAKCRSEEQKLKRICQETGKVSGNCPDVSGPNAWPSPAPAGKPSAKP